MISELKDDEILEFLMTSEFQDNYSPSEFRFLLFKWRSFYRLIHGVYERDKNKSESDIKKLSSDIENFKKENESLKHLISKKEKEYNRLANKKLSIKERLLGKIINNDENKRI
jgi:hypothetical protein